MKEKILRCLVASLMGVPAICSADPQLFQDTISIANFGSIPNTVASLQPGTYINQSPGSLRTNDFQNLQSVYQTYASNRPITRMGAFLISQGGVSSTVGPNGPGVTFPALCYANDSADSPANPAENITTNATTTLLVFSAVETNTFTLSGDLDSSKTRQSAILTYANPSDSAQFIRDYNVVGNAFHDILYQGLTPSIFADGYTHLKEITVFSAAEPSGQTISNPVPPNNYALPAGHKFRITVVNTQTNQTQTWLLYLQPPDGTTSTLPEIVFNGFFNGSGNNILVASAPFTGFMRVGIVQNGSVPFNPAPSGTASEVPDWSTSLGIQTIASTAASMYILWPAEFTKNALAKIQTNFKSGTYLPYCPWVSIYLPLVALNDPKLAANYFNCLLGKIPPPKNTPYPFDGGTNPFLSYVYMLMGKYYSQDIGSYQSSNRAFPGYSINATAASIESVYDSFRDVIPLNAEFSFTASTYQWTYDTLIRSTSAETEPLIIFPAYKTLSGSAQPISGFKVMDPIKGPLYASAASSGSLTFQESLLPSFMTDQFFPQDLWSKLTPGEQTNLQSYWSSALKDQLAPGNILAISSLSDGYGNGKFLNQAGQSVLFGAYMLNELGQAPSTIKTATEPTINAIKSVVQDWLINIQAAQRQQQGANFPNPFVQNFFVGDSTVPGLCYSVRGMQGGANGAVVGQDFGNAAYNDHHFASGYWLGAIAAVVEWENLYAAVAPNPSTTPWIATEFSSAAGLGPYKMKAFVDMLWRDTRNPDPSDPDFPYNRHGNPWEGHSTANGLNLMPYSAGRNQESLAEDFNSWLSTLYYARAILNIYNNASFSGAFTANDVEGFDVLESFCTVNMLMTATSGNLYYKTSNWPYAGVGFNFNVTAAQQYDNLVDSATFFLPGTPACQCTSEEAINSPDRLETFYDDFFGF